VSQSDIPARALAAFPFPLEFLRVSRSASTLAREGGGWRTLKERSRIREMKSRLCPGVESWVMILVGAEVARVAGRTLVSASLAGLKAGAGEGPSRTRTKDEGDSEMDFSTSFADRKGVEHGT